MLTNINMLLCPTDGSKAAMRGVEYAISLAKTLENMQLTFLLVTTLSEEGADITEARYLGRTIIEAAEIQDHIELDAACKKAKAEGITKLQCIKIHSRGNTAAAIVDFAEKEGFQNIVMGSTGRTGVARLLLGSVASEVVAKAHCPVTVVR